jgi:hypothetical protein
VPSDPSLDRLRSQLSAAQQPANIQAAVTLKTMGTAYGERTVVRIDHRLPEPGRGDYAAFRVTTREQFLPRAHFDRSVREIVNRAVVERGRRIYAIELSSQEVMAVLSYHLHDSPGRPLLITALGTRADADGTPDLYARSLALVWLLKQYAHTISKRTERGGYVDMDAANRSDVIAVLRRLGFRDAPRVSGFNPSGRHLRQDAVGQR